MPSSSSRVRPSQLHQPAEAGRGGGAQLAPALSLAQEWLLRVAVTAGGAAVMVVEILGSRMLAPSFGTTLHVWSALITVALVGLAVGYAVGGRLADWRPGPGPLMVVLSIATALLLISDLMAKPTLRLAYGAGLIGGAFIAALALFLPTLFMLGMVSPMAVRAAARQAHLGKTVGNLYALSTIGSVAGSLAVSLVFIPNMGVHTAIVITAATLGLVPFCYLLLVARYRLAVLLLAGLAVALVVTKVAGEEADREIYFKGESYPVTERAPSAYGDLVISDHHQTRFMFLNGVVQGSLRGSFSGSLYAYAMMRLVTARGLPSSVLMWGLGAGLVARALAEAGVEVTVIEIDPVVERLARHHFGLPDAVKVIIGDARTETLKLAGSYEVVVLDAFSGDTPPFHLLTREAFLSLRQRLAPQGLVVANLVGGLHGEAARVVSSVAMTMEEVFGSSQAFAPNQQYAVATMFLTAGELPEEAAPFTLPIPENMRGYVDSVYASRVRLPRDQAIVLTDDYAPLDVWSDPAVKAMRYRLEPSNN